MPAADDNRLVALRFVKNALRVLFSHTVPETDACIVWGGNHTSGNPVIRTGDGAGAENVVSVRGALSRCRGTFKMTCSTPLCINPRHMKRARTARPSDIGQGRHMTAAGPQFSPKLDASQVSAVRAMLSEGHSQKAVADRLGVSQSTISRIARAQ